LPGRPRSSRPDATVSEMERMYVDFTIRLLQTDAVILTHTHY
jgi:hypothetical protein